MARNLLTNLHILGIADWEMHSYSQKGNRPQPHLAGLHMHPRQQSFLPVLDTSKYLGAGRNTIDEDKPTLRSRLTCLHTYRDAAYLEIRIDIAENGCVEPAAENPVCICTYMYVI